MEQGSLAVTPINRPIFDLWPTLRGRLPWLELATLPTRVDPLERVTEATGLAGARAWIKRDDLSSEIYGGNKVRTLEVLFGRSLARGTTHIYATGAYGSNHALATALHAPRAGLCPGALLFPQPPSRPALENLLASLSAGGEVLPVLHWSTLPLAMARCLWRCRKAGRRAEIMVPGGATPYGALGYVSAGLELAHQVAQGVLPAPESIVIAVGSTCTSAGLLVGLHHAARAGIGFEKPPRLVSIRVTPWPVTSAFRISKLAAATSRTLAALADDPSLEISRRALSRQLEVDGTFLGRGYGVPTPEGRRAMEAFEIIPGLTLDSTYSAKAAAGLLSRLRIEAQRPTLFWSTKSSVTLPANSPEGIEASPRLIKWWIDRTRRSTEETSTERDR
jgi:D-cysteine desulfhydrase